MSNPVSNSESNQDNPSNNNEKKKVSEEFVNNVKNYLMVDDKLREIKNKTKELIIEKKKKEEFILKYLKDIEENIIDVHDGKIKRNISKSQAPLKKETIQKVLTEIVGDATKAQTITDKIIKSRPIIERITLKRTKNKVQDIFINENH